MKNNISPLIKGIFLLFLISFNVSAQDWKSVNPKMSRVLEDTTFVRATEVTFAPGEKSDMHSHPAHFIYALTAGKLKVTYKDGKSQILDLKAGETGVSGPERPHTTENIGKKTAKFLLVELKEHPYIEMKE